MGLALLAVAGILLAALPLVADSRAVRASTAVVSALALAGASPAAGNSAKRAAATITISSYEYHTPARVAPGATVLVRNKDDVSHTASSKAEGLVDDTAAGGSTTHFTAPSKPGHYDFYGKYTPTCTACWWWPDSCRPRCSRD